MKVITYQSSNGAKINLSLSQVEKLEGLEIWPKDHLGEDICQVSHGAHFADADMSDADLLEFCGYDHPAGCSCGSPGCPEWQADQEIA